MCSLWRLPAEQAGYSAHMWQLLQQHAISGRHEGLVTGLAMLEGPQ